MESRQPEIKIVRDILREQMKFDGVLISDWAAIEETIYHGYCADREEAAVRAVEAGVDIDMMTGIYSEKSVSDGQGWKNKRRAYR